MEQAFCRFACLSAAEAERRQAHYMSGVLGQLRAAPFFMLA